MSTTNEFDAQWRASAHEAVPYMDDNPESLNVLPELTDGSIGQGKATRIEIQIELVELDGKLKGLLYIRDNGKGITNIKRLLSWASKQSIDTHHRYGHGSKKCLTKWSKDYLSAIWHVKYRTCDKRGVSSSLIQYGNPYRGLETEVKEDEEDESALMPSGTEWFVEFQPDILGSELQMPKPLFARIKEIMRTRYSRKYFDTTEFIVEIKNGDQVERQSSKDNKWNTFQECLEEELAKGEDKSIVELVYDRKIMFHEGIMNYKHYSLSGVSGQQSFDIKKEFPTYGNKNMKSSRLHIALDGRTIEIAPLWHFYSDRNSNHNGLNGHFGFVNFVPNTPGNFETMPTPCTTKVSFYENCPHYKEFVKIIMAIHDDPPIDIIKPTIIKPTIEKSPIEKSPIEKSPIDIIKPTIEKPTIEKPTIDIIKLINDIIEPKPLSLSQLYQQFTKTTMPIISQEHQEWTVKQCQEENSRLWIIEKTKYDREITKKPLKSQATSVKEKTSIPKKVRDDVWNTWIDKSIAQHKCLCCKKTIIEKTEFHCGHVKSEVDGGSVTIDNLRPICASCNFSMGSMNMVEFIKKYEYYL